MRFFAGRFGSVLLRKRPRQIQVNPLVVFSAHFRELRVLFSAHTRPEFNMASFAAGIAENVAADLLVSNADKVRRIVDSQGRALRRRLRSIPEYFSARKMRRKLRIAPLRPPVRGPVYGPHVRRWGLRPRRTKYSRFISGLVRRRARSFFKRRYGGRRRRYTRKRRRRSRRRY